MQTIDQEHQLKQLINYHRYVVKPLASDTKTYNLYMQHWGNPDLIDFSLASNPSIRPIGA
jgi:hypothetical protein